MQQQSHTTIALLALLFLAIGLPWHHSKAAAASEEPLKEKALEIDSRRAQLTPSITTDYETIQAVIKQIENLISEQAPSSGMYNEVPATTQQENLDLTPLGIKMLDVSLFFSREAKSPPIFMDEENKALPTWFVKSFRDKNQLVNKKEAQKENKAWAQHCDVWYIFYKKVIDAKKSLNNTHYPYLWLYKKVFEKAWYYIDVKWGLWLNAEESRKLLTYMAEEDEQGTHHKQEDHDENKPNFLLPNEIVQEIFFFSDMITYYDESTAQFIKKVTANLTTYAYWDQLYQGHLIPYLLIMVPSAIQHIEIEALFTWYNSFLNANPYWGVSSRYFKAPENSQLARLLEAAIVTHLKSNPQYIGQWIKYTAHKKGHQEMVWSVAYAPQDHRIAAGSADQNITLAIWNGKTGEISQRCNVEKRNPLYLDTQAIYSLAWANKGNRIASTSSHDKVCVWSTDTGQKLRTFEGRGYYAVYEVAWSPDNDYLVASTYRTVRTLNLNNNEETLFRRHESEIYSVSWAFSNYFASASRNGNVRIWDTKYPSKEVALLPHHGGMIKKVRWSHKGLLFASAGEDKKVYVRQWDQQKRQATSLHTFTGHTAMVNSICWSHDDLLLASAGDDRTIHLWDLKTKKVKKVLLGHTDDVLSLSFSHDDCSLVSAGKDSTIRIWDIKNGQQLRIIEAVDPRMANLLSHPIILENKALLHNIEIPADDFIALFGKISTDEALSKKRCVVHAKWSAFEKATLALPFIEKCIQTKSQLQADILITFCRKIVEEEQQQQKADEAQAQQTHNEAQTVVISDLLSPALILASVGQASHSDQQNDTLNLVLEAITQKPDAFFGDQASSCLAKLKGLLSQRKVQGEKPNDQAAGHLPHINQSNSLNDPNIAAIDLEKCIQKVEAAQNKLSNKYIKCFAAHKILTLTISIVFIGLLYMLYNTFFANKNTN